MRLDLEKYIILRQLVPTADEIQLLKASAHVYLHTSYWTLGTVRHSIYIELVLAYIYSGLPNHVVGALSLRENYSFCLILCASKQDYDGPKEALARVEQFFLQIIEIPRYIVRQYSRSE